MSEIIDYIGWYADEALKPASRFSSWQPCYEYFGRRDVRSDRRTVLELGFYLASWGMYRGSGKAQLRPNAEGDWAVTEVPTSRIIDDATFAAERKRRLG